VGHLTACVFFGESKVLRCQHRCNYRVCFQQC